MGVIPPLIMGIVTIYVSFRVSKYSSERILEEAIKIRKVVTKAVKAIVPKEIWSKVRNIEGARKGGKVRADPIGSWLSEKTGGLSDFFMKPTSKDEGRISEIVEESAKKHGIDWKARGKKDANVDLTPVK